MQFPVDRFPFDILDPDPEHCGNCSCELAEVRPSDDCRNLLCDCHQELGPNGLRYRWGDR